MSKAVLKKLAASFHRREDANKTEKRLNLEWDVKKIHMAEIALCPETFDYKVYFLLITNVIGL